MNTNKYHCPLMDHQLMIDYYGRMFPCCNYHSSPLLEQHKDDYEPFEEYLDPKKYRILINKKHDLIKQGKEIHECNLCWEKEKSGVKSLRQQAITDSERHAWHEAGSYDILKLDIRLHNKCNLACTMCWEGASSLWGKLKNIEDPEKLISETQLKNIKENLGSLRCITLQGGEPFYGNEYVEFIDNLPNKSNIEIDFFTNLITVDLNAVSRWAKEFKLLVVNASVDGTEEVYESIRWPTTWKKWNRNALKVYKIFKENGPTSKLRFHFASQAENLSNFPDFLLYAKKNFPDCTVENNYIQFPRELSIYATTEKERNIFLEKMNRVYRWIDITYWEEMQFDKLIKLVTTIQDDTELIKQRKEYLKNVYKLRADYK